ncbi:type II secretion system F family protein [Parablautia muri]|uniref:Type II secretion system F family protein n=1 Tax=Parablautia muri TaxID=2320879 RepID=A0A9X5BG22_9FIRM|nr:type II secretion system F family protein [Parablautia muri]NBJ93044.1 type II secretion system F family protein [Parablautia muri]
MKRMISHEGISSLCLELSLLLQAGVGAGDALALLLEDSDPEYKELLEAMADEVDQGASLSTAFKNTGRFPVYVSGLLEVGEQVGRSVEALSALSRYYEYRVRLDRRIRSSLLYPAVMLLLMLLVIGVLLVKVLPIFDDVYRSLGGRLSGVAGGLLTLGRWLDKIMPVLWVLMALVVVFFAALAVSENFREKLMGMWRKTHGDSGLSKKMNTARIAQAVSMGMTSGLATEEAISLAAKLLEDVPDAVNRCADCRKRLEQGEKLGNALKESGLLPGASCRLLELGFKSGSGDTAMEKIARDMSEASEAALEDAVGRVEPALVLVCSVLVGLILLSVMLPLMHIMAAIG